MQQLCDLTMESDNNLIYKLINKLKPEKSSNIFKLNTRTCCKTNADYKDAEKEHILVFHHHLITELTSDRSSAKIVLFKYTCKILLHFAFMYLQKQTPTNQQLFLQISACTLQTKNNYSWALEELWFLITYFSHHIWYLFHPVLTCNTDILLPIASPKGIELTTFA